GYWQKQLDELPVAHSLGLDIERPKNKQNTGATVTGQLPKATGMALLEVAKAHKLTPFMLLHGGLALLLSHHSNSHDIVVGTPIANRLQDELQGLIGFFVNTLVLRADTHQQTHNNSLSAYFAHVRQVHLDAQSNQDVPFEQLVERLKAPRSTAHGPLFQIMLITHTDYSLNDGSDSPAFALPGIELKAYQSDIVQEKFDMTVNLRISEQGVGLHWSYDVSLFSEQHINQLNSHLCRLLEGLSVSGPAQTLDALPLLSPDETKYLVDDINDTQIEYPRDKCIHQLFEQQAELNPDAVAVVYDVHGSTNAVGAGMRRNGGDQQLTYKQLNQKANQLAHYLIAEHHIKPDTLIGLCVERSLEMMIGLLAILKAGGAYVPLDPSYPQDRLDYMFEDASVEVILSQSQLRQTLTDFNGCIVNLDGLTEQEHFCAEEDSSNLVIDEHKSSNLAYVIYTSGSTGKPKGVLTEHISVAR
ncbi:MAG: condensation domain-containing protein, partial [Psychrosphaera sp.]|nr:condensation domain-containing protein [Psychrosphaera sp.]